VTPHRVRHKSSRVFPVYRYGTINENLTHQEGGIRGDTVGPVWAACRRRQSILSCTGRRKFTELLLRVAYSRTASRRRLKRRLLANSLEEAAEVEPGRGHLGPLDGEPPLLKRGAYVVLVVHCDTHRDSAISLQGFGVCGMVQGRDAS